MSSSDSPQQARSEDRVVGDDNTRAIAWAHVALNALLAALFIFLFVRAGALPSSMWEPLGSGAFPRLILGVLILLNLGIIAQELHRGLDSPHSMPGLWRDWLWRHRLALGVLGLFSVYALIVPTLGFRLASFAFLILAQVLLGARQMRGLIIAVVIAALFSFGIEMLFRDVFTISLPRGVLG